MGTDQLAEWSITLLIIGGGLLIVAAKATGQTIGELFRDIREFLQEGTEDTTEAMTYYE